MKTCAPFALVILLMGCAGEMTTPMLTRFDMNANEIKPDAYGWYTFGDTRFKGSVVQGAPDGVGLCFVKELNASAVACSFNRGVRSDKTYVEAKEAELAEQTAIRLAYERKERIEREAAESRRISEINQARREAEASFSQHLAKTNRENAQLVANLDRQTNAAIAEANRIRAAQAAERERARAERDEREAERRREAAREREARERAAREEADRPARVKVAAAQEKTFSTYSQPQVVIEPTRQTCPPGFKPAGWTTPSTAVCLKDPQSTAGQAGSGQGSGGNGGGNSASGSAAGRTATANTRNRANEDALASNTRSGEVNGATLSDTTARPPTPVTSGNSSTNNSRAPITNDPDPYANDQFNWRHTGSGSATTRQAACSKAQAQTEVEIARLKAVGVNTTKISPCVCFDNDKFYAGQAATLGCRVYIQTKAVKEPPTGVAR